MAEQSQELVIEMWPDTTLGGQHFGTSSGIKMTHPNTGMVAISEASKSPHENLVIAKAMIKGGIDAIVELGTGGRDMPVREDIIAIAIECGLVHQMPDGRVNAFPVSVDDLVGFAKTVSHRLAFFDNDRGRTQQG